MQKVHWPGYPTLLMAGSTRIFRVVFWDDELQRWAALVPVRSAVPGDCIEFTPDDLERIRILESKGMPLLDARRRVLGV